MIAVDHFPWLPALPSAQTATKYDPAAYLPALVNRCIVHPPAFPRIALAIPTETAGQIDALTLSALGPGLTGDLPTVEELATYTTFGPSADRMIAVGLSPSLACSVARWGSTLYRLATRINDICELTQWHRGKAARAAERQARASQFMARVGVRAATNWGGMKLASDTRDTLASQMDVPIPKHDGEAIQARLTTYQLEGRIRYLLSTGGLPCRMAVAQAALFDGAGWEETALMLAGEMTPLKAKISERNAATKWVQSVAHDAVTWAERAWRVSGAPSHEALLDMRGFDPGE